MRLLTLSLLSLSLALPLSAHADTFEYSYSSQNNGITDQVSFDVFTTGAAAFNQILPAAECYYVPYGNCQGIFIDQEVNSSPFGSFDTYTIAYVFGSSLDYEGALIDLTADDFTVGSHPVPFSSGDLVVRQIAATPEPSSFALLTTGISGAAALGRRRFVRRSI